MKLTGAEMMIRALEQEGADTVFGYPGAAICPFYDALLGSSIHHVLTRHEQGAAHAASGYARATGKAGVCVATSGPGATNLITGIATAYMDSIPMVAITGQVASELIGKDVFQEADITGATAPFCKHNYLVKHTRDLPRIIREAFHIATTGRPGPVVIDVPIDVMQHSCEYQPVTTVEIKGYKPNLKAHPGQIRKIADILKSARKPVIVAGGGVISAGAADLLVRLAQKLRIPVVNTLMGIGAVPAGMPVTYGMLGSHGRHAANYAIHHADLVMILGARVGDRAMGSARVIAEKAKIIHVDIDPAEIGKNVHVTIPLVADLKGALEDLLPVAEPGDTAVWVAELDKQAAAHTHAPELKDNGFVRPQHVLETLGSLLSPEALVATEVGQNQIWSANHYPVRKPGGFITSGGMGTMGYGLPAGVGAQMGAPDKTVVVVAGDGSFQMSMQELGTIRQENLPLKMIIFNNTRLGMVRELQTARFESRYSQVYLECNPDFGMLVGAYGFPSRRTGDHRQVEEVLRWLVSQPGAALAEFLVHPEEPTLG